MTARVKTKIRILLLLLTLSVAAVIFVGWGKQPVELLNETPPLIDLDAAIVPADYGTNGNTDGDTGESSQQDSGGGNGTSQQEKESKTILLTANMEELTYGVEQYRISKENLKRKLLADYETGDLIYLRDDYAEAHFYREILTILEELRMERDFEYSAD